MIVLTHMSHNQWVISEAWSERGPDMMGTNAVTRKALSRAMLCERGVRAKLSILKSGQDRLTLQASLSHWEPVKGLDNRQADVANWQPGPRDWKANKTETWKSQMASGAAEREDVRKVGRAGRQSQQARTQTLSEREMKMLGERQDY